MVRIEGGREKKAFMKLKWTLEKEIINPLKFNLKRIQMPDN